LARANLDENGKVPRINKLFGPGPNPLDFGHGKTDLGHLFFEKQGPVPNFWVGRRGKFRAGDFKKGASRGGKKHCPGIYRDFLGTFFATKIFKRARDTKRAEKFVTAIFDPGKKNLGGYQIYGFGDKAGFWSPKRGFWGQVFPHICGNSRVGAHFYSLGLRGQALFTRGKKRCREILCCRPFVKSKIGTHCGGKNSAKGGRLWC